MSEVTNRYPHINGMSPVTAKLVELLRNPETPGTLTDEMLYDACGRICGVGGEGYPNLMTAIRHVARNNHINWRREFGAGAIIRLDAKQSVDAADGDRRHIKRTATKAVVTLANAKIETLPQPEQVTARAMLAQMGALTQFAASNTTKQLEARQAKETPNMRALLAAFTPAQKQA